MEATASYSQASRRDIVQARNTFQTVRDGLVYKDEEVLETGMQKVQPLQYLDEEILKYRDQIQASVSKADQIQDGVPSRLLSQVNWVIDEASRGKATLYKASALLEFTSEAFLYARRAAQDRFDLSRAYFKKLGQFDEVFTKMMEARLNARIEEALRNQDECINCVERAVEESEKDMQAHKGRSQEEEEQVKKVGSLEEVKSSMGESIRDEMSELEMIRDHCKADVNTIKSSMGMFAGDMQKASDNYSRQDSEWKGKLKKNRQEQESLRKRLQQLEQEERRLEKDIEEGKVEENQARTVRTDAHKLVGAWCEKIGDLQNRVETSINIMSKMKGMTETILSDAQEKQRAVKEKLYKLEVEGLLGKRDTLMAHGVMCMLITSDCKVNIKSSEEELVRLEKDKRAAAKTMLAAKVSSAKHAIEEYNQTKMKYVTMCKENEEKLRTISQALGQVDEALRTLRPSLKLDSMEDRYKERHRLMEQAFEQDSIGDIHFCSTKHEL